MHHISQLIDGTLYLEQDLLGVFGILHARFHRLEIALHHQVGGLGLLLDAANHLANLGTGSRCAVGKGAHLVSNNRKAPPHFPCSGRLNRGIESQQIGLLRDTADGGDDLADLPRLLLEGIDRDSALAHLLYHTLHARAGRGDILAALGGQLAYFIGILGGHAAVIRDSGSNLYHLFTVMVQSQRVFCCLAAALADGFHPIDRGMDMLADVLVVVHRRADHLLQLLDKAIDAIGERPDLIIPLQVDAHVEIAIARGYILHAFIYL